MKMLKRTDNTIDYVKLLAADSQKHGIEAYSEQAIKEFGDRVQGALSSTLQSEHRRRGLRAEALFMAVIAGIGKVTLIKAEDEGNVYYTGDDILIPDFRVVTKDGTEMLIEVKTHQLDGSFTRNLKLSDNYIQKLLRYCKHTKADLRIAIFWEEVGRWTLNRLEAFEAGIAGKKQWAISFPRATATNEMVSVGDCSIATLWPLIFRILVDPQKSDYLPPGKDGEITIQIAGIHLLSQDRVLSGLASQIAWKLLWYGNWEEIKQKLHYDGDQLLWIDHIYGPSGWDETEIKPTDPAIIGALSEMISMTYLRGAENTIHTTSKDGMLEPGYMGNFIPDDFVSLKLDLPLYVFSLQPNFDFKAD